MKNINMKTLARKCLALLLGLLFTLQACNDFLEEDPESFISPQNFYQTRSDALAALNGAYAGFLSRGYGAGQMYFTMVAFPTPQISTRREPQQNNGQFDHYEWDADADYLGTVWSSIYLAINRANAVIDNVPSIDMDETLRRRIVAEARFLRARHYFTLVRFFGGVPLRKNETTSLDSLNLSRASTDEVYNFVIQDLQQAIETLPLASEYEGSDFGRASEGAAKMLLAKVYMQRGSVSTCGICGTMGATPQSDDYQQAVNLLEDVINSGEYGLVADYGSLFNLDTEVNEEVIFSIQHITVEGQGRFDQQWLNPRGSGWMAGQYNQTNAELPFYFSYKEGDLRRDASWITEYIDASGKLRTLDPTDVSGTKGDFGLPGPALGKLIIQRRDIGGWAVNPKDLVAMRYADALLLYAEALNEVNGGPTGEAYNAINQVRFRAGLSAGLTPGLSYQQFRDSVFTERQWELVQEGHGWFDGQRFFDLFVEQVEANAALGGAPPYVDGGTTPQCPLTVAIPKHRLYPIPQSAIDRNPNLTQNEGYGVGNVEGGCPEI